MDIIVVSRSAIISAFESNKRLADRAIAQLPSDKLHLALDENTNSVAVIMKRVGQIVLVARIHAGGSWNTLTIPKGGSKEYNKKYWGPRGRLQ